jgi:hypothetical protein
MDINDLLSPAVNAHGGLSRWNQLKRVTATLSITGAIWEVKGKPDALKTSASRLSYKKRVNGKF